jgi:general secretion pathway protein D
MQNIKKMIVFLCTLPILAGCAGGLDAFNKAQGLEKQGKLDEAVMKYAEAAAANPDTGEYRMRFLTASVEAARVHFRKGEQYLALKNYDTALGEYQTAYALDPSLERCGQMIDQVMKLKNCLKFVKEGEEFEKNRKPREALGSYNKALGIDPGNVEAKEAVDRLLKSRKTKLDGFELNLKSTKPITLKFKDAKIKEVFNILSQLSGINFVFDEGMKDQNVSIFLENATFQQALEILAGINKLGKKVLNESTIIVYPKTPEKNKQYEELRVETFQLNKLDAKKAVNLIRTMLPAKKIYVNEEMNALVIRDTPDAIEIVRKILEANDIPDAEVVLEVEIVEISKSNADNFGLVLSKYQVSTAALGPGGKTFLSDTLTQPTTTTTTTTGSTTSGTTNTDVTNLLNIFSWRNFAGYLTVPNAAFNFAKTLSKGQTLANPRIRVKNREKSKFNVGTRVPITTTSSPVGGGVSVNVQYIDVGVKMNAEPTVQLNDDINIKLSLEVSSVINRQTVGDSTSLTTVVTIGTRNLDTVLSLKDGETSIIGGLIQDNKTDSKQTISIIGDIPIIGPLLTGTNKSNDKTELVLAITPHIVRGIAVPDADVASFWSGKEDEPSAANPYASFVQEPELLPAQPAGQAPPAGPTPTGIPGAQTMPASPAAPAAQTPPVAPAMPAVPVLPVTPYAPAAPLMPDSKAPTAMPGTILNITVPPTVRLNERVSVGITAANVTNLYSAPFVLVYDPAILDFEGAGEGPFLNNDGKPTSFQATKSQKNGQITVSLSRVGNVGGVNGAGMLASLTFKAKSQGSAKLGFSTVHFTDPGGRPMDVMPFNAVVEVKQPGNIPAGP